MSNMAHRRDPTGIRAQRIQAIHAMVRKDGEVKLVPLLAKCEYEMGLTRKTVKTYLRTLEDLGFVQVDEENDVVREVKEE